MKRLILIAALCLMVGCVGASINDYNSSLVLLMHMNQSPTNTNYFNDSFSNRLFSTMGNSITNTSAKQLGNASGWFNGTANYLATANSADFNFGSGNFTIVMWVYPNTNDRKGLAGTITSGGASGWDIERGSTSTGNIEFHDYNSGGADAGHRLISSTNAIYPSIWQQIVVSRAGNTLNIYVNGTSVATGNWGTGSLNNSATAMTIGGQGGYVGRTWSGNIDELAIWKGVAVPITDLYPQTIEFNTTPLSVVTPISASFTQSPNPSSVGRQSVTYTDTSTGSPTTWNWTLAGTSPTNTTRNSTYTYATAGTYNIFLNVTNSTGSWSNTSQTHTVSSQFSKTIYYWERIA